MDPSVQRVAVRHMRRQASREIEAAFNKALIPMSVRWKPAGPAVTNEDKARARMSEAEMKDWLEEHRAEARIGHIRGVLGIELEGQRSWLAMEVPVVDESSDGGPVVTYGPMFGAHEVRFIRGSEKPFRTEPELAEAVVYLLAGQGSLDRPLRARSKAVVAESLRGTLKIKVGEGMWKVKRGKSDAANAIQPKASPFVEQMIGNLVTAWERETGQEQALVPAWSM